MPSVRDLPRKGQATANPMDSRRLPSMRSKYLALVMMLVLPLLYARPSSDQNTTQPGPDAARNDVDQFFPGQVPAGHGDIWARINSRDLRLMGENPLADLASPQVPQIYRVLIQTRPHNVPVLARLCLGVDGTGEAVIKVSQSARFADVLTTSRSIKVSPTDAGEFLRRLATSDFWSMPTFETFDIHQPVAVGSASWMFEVEKEGKYHAVFRSGASLTSLRDVASFLVANIGQLDLSANAALSGDGKQH